MDSKLDHLYPLIIQQKKEVIWNEIKYFKPKEFGQEVEKINPHLIYTADYLRWFIGIPMIITAGYCKSGHSSKSTHYKGLAIDFYFKYSNSNDINYNTIIYTFKLLEFIGRTKLSDNGGYGLGVYIDWIHSPGFHLDLRPNKISYWSRINNKYERLETTLKYCSKKLIGR